MQRLSLLFRRFVSLKLCFALYVSVLAGFTQASAADAPHQRIEQTTQQLIVKIVEAKGYFEKDPERFYAEVDTILSPLVDFKSFARAVMGPFGTRDYYKSLNAEQRSQFKSDYARFVETFKSGLISTYAKGLLVFDGQKITVIPATAEEQALIAEKKAVSVLQTIAASSETYEISYKMAPNKAGEWKLKNVVIESINVGQLYRNQFVSAMKKYDNNFAKLIDNWIAETEDTDFKGEKADEAPLNAPQA